MNVRPEIPAGCGSSLRDLMVECWSPNPKDRPSFAAICDKLDRCLIDEAIRSKTGRKLWRKKRFIGNEEVAWKVFEKELRSMLKRDSVADEIKFKCLKEVLAADPKKKLGKNKEVVNIMKYGAILDWFGPFERDAGGLDFLDRLEDMLKKKWFHGDISTPKVFFLFLFLFLSLFLFLFLFLFFFFFFSFLFFFFFSNDNSTIFLGHRSSLWTRARDIFDPFFFFCSRLLHHFLCRC